VACGRNETARKHINHVTKENSSLYNESYMLDSTDYDVINEALYQNFALPPSILHRYPGLNPTPITKILTEIKSFVLLDSTSLISWCDSLELVKEIDDHVLEDLNKVDISDTSWIKNIVAKNCHPSLIDSSRLKYIPYKIASTSSINKLFSESEGWDSFWSIYGRPSLLIKVSIPSYNKNRDKAMIYIEFGSSGKSGEGCYLWLKKIEDKWIAYDILTLWVS